MRTPKEILTLGTVMGLSFAASSAGAAEERVFQFNDARELAEWKINGPASMDSSKKHAGEGGAFKLEPGSSATLQLRGQNGSGKIELWIYDDMTRPKDAKAVRAGPRWGLIQSDGHVLVVGMLYAWWVPGMSAYTASDSNQKNWLDDFHYLGIDRTPGWHMFTFDFDPEKGLSILHNDSEVTDFYWSETSITGFNGIVLYGDEKKEEGQNLWVDDIRITLGGDVVVRLQPSYKLKVERKDMSDIPLEVRKKGKAAINAYRAAHNGAEEESEKDQAEKTEAKKGQGKKK